MANVSVITDPLDELRLTSTGGSDRLPAMLFLAALFHGILILGVTFNPELAAPLANAISLEVTIVADPDQSIDAPDDAEYLAQASQQGGGNTVEKIRPSAAPQSAMPVDNPGVEDGTAMTDAETHDRAADDLLTTRNERPEQVEIDPRTEPEPERSVALAMESGATVTLPLPQEEDASLLLTDNDPQQLVISANTRESVAAAYLDTWKRRIEGVGAAYLPELGELGTVTGSPTLLVTIDRNGELIDAVVSRSSGSTVLDLASVDIIRRSAPFNAFSDEMATQYEDKVAFEYKFLFANERIGGTAN